METKTKWIKDVHKLDIVSTIHQMMTELPREKRANGYKYIIGDRSFHSTSCAERGIYLEYPAHEK